MSTRTMNIPESIAFTLGIKPLPAPPFTGAVIEKQPAKPKNVRGRAGRLASLKDMPMDIFLEIVVKLHPKDLLVMARSSKHFRSLLMNAGSRNLWVESFKNVPGVPKCPPWVALPRFAAVLFDQYCFACGNARSSHVNHSVWVRLCAGCSKTNFMTGEAILGQQEYPPRLLTVLPMLCRAVMYTGKYTIRTPLDARKNSHTTSVFYAPEYRAVAQRLLSMTQQSELQTMMRERIPYVTATQCNAMTVLEWVEQTMATKLAEEDGLRADRKAAILARLGELGYTTADYPDNDAWKKIVNQTTRLTDRIWKNALPKLRILIDQKHADDDRAAYERRLDARRAEFALFYDDVLLNALSDEDRVYAPNCYDACRTPSVEQLIAEGSGHVKVTRERVAAIREQFARDVREGAAKTKRDLVRFLRRREANESWTLVDDMPIGEVDAELTRAWALFLCSRCSHLTPSSAPDICAHWRGEHPSHKWDDEWSPYSSGRTHRNPQIYAVPLGWHIRTALAMLGLPEDTSLAQMDSWVREGRLICLCGHPELASLKASGWSGMVWHINKEDNYYDNIRGNARRRKPNPKDPQLIDSHCFFGSGKTFFLQLLGEGEDAMLHEWDVPHNVAAEVTALLNANEVRPICRICYEMVSAGHHGALYLEKDVQVLAHHMKTRHDTILSANSICFHA